MKLFTKAYFAGRGQRATFMAQLSEEFPGLGGHPSLSLHSTVNGEPLLAEETGVLSKQAGSAVAGVVALLTRAAGHGGTQPELLPAVRAGQLGTLDGHLGAGQLQLRTSSGGRRAAGHAARTANIRAPTPSPTCVVPCSWARRSGASSRTSNRRHRCWHRRTGAPSTAPPGYRGIWSTPPAGSNGAVRPESSSERRSSSTTRPPGWPRRRRCRRFVPRREQLRYLHGV